MSAQSLSNKCKWLLVCAVLLCDLGSARSMYKGLEDDRSNAHKHGLFEIQQAAADFIKKFNHKHHTDYKALAPDLRIRVPRCATSLRVVWLRDEKLVADGTSVVQRSVAVTCRQTIPGSPTNNWSVDVPILKPAPQ